MGLETIHGELMVILMVFVGFLMVFNDFFMVLDGFLMVF